MLKMSTKNPFPSKMPTVTAAVKPGTILIRWTTVSIHHQPHPVVATPQVFIADFSSYNVRGEGPTSPPKKERKRQKRY